MMTLKQVEIDRTTLRLLDEVLGALLYAIEEGDEAEAEVNLDLARGLVGGFSAPLHERQGAPYAKMSPEEALPLACDDVLWAIRVLKDAIEAAPASVFSDKVVL